MTQPNIPSAARSLSMARASTITTGASGALGMGTLVLGMSTGTVPGIIGGIVGAAFGSAMAWRSGKNTIAHARNAERAEVREANTRQRQSDGAPGRGR